MRRHLLLALGAAAGLALAGNLLAQGTPVQVPPGTPTSTVTGSVVSSTGTELVLDTANGRQRFVVDANSTLPASLDVSARVSVEFHRLDGDRMHVARVTVAPSSVPPRATPSEKAPPASTDRDAERPARSADATLPRTAGPLPVVGLLGVAALAGSAALRLAGRR